MTDKTVNYFMGLDYPVTVNKKDGEFYLYIPESYLMVQGADLKSAYEQLEGEKREFFEKHIKLDRQDSIPLPARLTERRRLSSQLTPFLVKAAVVALIGIGVVVAATVSVTYTLENTPQNVAQKAVRYSMKKFVATVEKNLTPEREEKILRALRQLVPRLKPYADELAPLFDYSERKAANDKQ